MIQRLMAEVSRLGASNVVSPLEHSLRAFTEGGFRFFMPAYLVAADLEGLLRTANPVFHLTHGFSDRTVNLRPVRRFTTKSSANQLS